VTFWSDGFEGVFFPARFFAEAFLLPVFVRPVFFWPALAAGDFAILPPEVPCPAATAL
jgi:hypothetical protein